MRLIRRKASFVNAGCLYSFGHHDAARAIELLPPGERNSLHARQQPHLLGQDDIIAASTAFSVLAREAALAR